MNIVSSSPCNVIITIQSLVFGIKDNILLACITRMGKVIIPSGNDYIMAGDTIIVITTAEGKFKDINDIFAED